LWAAVAAIAVALWGCGDDDSSAGGGSSGGKSARAEFVEQANAICEEGKERGLEAMGAYAKEHPGSGLSQQEQLAVALQKAFLPELQKQVDEIRQLEPPAGDEQQVEAFLVATEEAVEASSKGPASTGDQFDPNFDRSARLARAYGLSGCIYG